MRVTVCPHPEQRWTLFKLDRQFTPESYREIYDWCTRLDGDDGRFHACLMHHRRMFVYIRDPNQALMFRLRWT